jgi:hypothetical protein
MAVGPARAVPWDPSRGGPSPPPRRRQCSLAGEPPGIEHGAAALLRADPGTRRGHDGLTVNAGRLDPGDGMRAGAGAFEERAWEPGVAGVVTARVIPSESQLLPLPPEGYWPDGAGSFTAGGRWRSRLPRQVGWPDRAGSTTPEGRAGWPLLPVEVVLEVGVPVRGHAVAVARALGVSARARSRRRRACRCRPRRRRGCVGRASGGGSG